MGSSSPTPSLGVSLSELRKRAGRSQAEVAGLISTTQSGVSRIERQSDIKMSTLADYVEALGGRLRVHAEFGDELTELSVHSLLPMSGISEERREYRVIWQDKETRSLVQVGWLEYTGVEFTFTYTEEARTNDRFIPFPSLPDTREAYRSVELFPFFALRLISTADPHYSAVLDSLGLTKERATPAELLARAPSDSPHDTIQVVPEPIEMPDGSLVRTFLLSGVRHAREVNPQSVDQVLDGLAFDTPLELLPEPENPADPRALQLLVDDVLIGWIPSYLVDEVQRYLTTGRRLSFTVERANGPGSPWHLRVLCRLTVTPL